MPVTAEMAKSCHSGGGAPVENTVAGDIASTVSTIFAGLLRLKRRASHQPLEEDRAA
jgi:hypothetical protein